MQLCDTFSAIPCLVSPIIGAIIISLLISAILYGFFMLGIVVQYVMNAELVPTHLLGRWYGILGMFSGFIELWGLQTKAANMAKRKKRSEEEQSEKKR